MIKDHIYMMYHLFLTDNMSVCHFTKRNKNKCVRFDNSHRQEISKGFGYKDVEIFVFKYGIFKP